ncbi:hypothetical protein ACFWMJ_23420 [Streptomyces hawaiiensis]|uniref:hypothetical protein n=1 Tax=Streptomyces hawaiiensis TaxID=67305 RepID=UPI0036563133
MSSAMQPETKITLGFAIVGWLIEAVASAAILLGDPEAINAVVGAGVPTVAFTIFAVLSLRADTKRPAGV